MNASNIAWTALALALTTGSAQAGTAEWKLDQAHTDVSFKVRHLTVSNTRGRFGVVEGTLHFDEKNPEKSQVDVAIDVNSVDTRDQKRDDHLRSPDFFDVAKYPKMTFKSTKVKKDGNGSWKVMGDLTLHGVTKPVTLEVEGPTPQIKDPWGNLRRGFTATTKIDRRDFGLTWNKALETGGLVVGNEVTITIDAEFMKPASQDA